MDEAGDMYAFDWWLSPTVLVGVDDTPEKPKQTSTGRAERLMIHSCLGMPRKRGLRSRRVLQTTSGPVGLRQPAKSFGSCDLKGGRDRCINCGVMTVRSRKWVSRTYPRRDMDAQSGDVRAGSVTHRPRC